MALYDSVENLALEIDSYELERREYVVSPEFTRVTTLVHLLGGGEEGVGEDLTYTESDAAAVTKTSRDAPPTDGLPRSGSCTPGSCSQLLNGRTMFTEPPEMEA